MPKHLSPAYHKELAQKAKKQGNMAEFEKQMTQARKAAKRK